MDVEAAIGPSCETGTYVRDGIFPFLTLPRELRDYIYEYTGPCAQPIPNEASIIINARHRPWPDADKFTGLILTCRQVYREWSSRNPRSRNIALRITDVNEYIETFFLPAEEPRGPMALRILDGSQPSIIDVTSLIDMSSRDPNLSLSFLNGGSRSGRDLDRLKATLITQKALMSSNPVSPGAKSPVPASVLPESEIMDSPPIPAPISKVKVLWEAIGGGVNSTDALIFLFDQKIAASWMHNDWTFSQNIKTMLWDLDSGFIPQEYLSKDERLRWTFWRSLDLHKLSWGWKVWIGVEGQEDFQLSKPGRLGLGWVWDHEEKLQQSRAQEQQESTRQEDKDSEGGSEGGSEGDNDEDNEDEEEQLVEEGSDEGENDLEYEEGENEGEEVRAELAWLQALTSRPEEIAQ